MKNYQLWQKTEEGWTVIQGKGRKINRKKLSPFYYVVHGERYERISEAANALGCNTQRIRYMCKEDKFPDCKQVRR